MQTVMVQSVKTACVLLVLLWAALLSTARLHPGAEVNAISTSKASAAIASHEIPKAKSQVAVIFDDRNPKKESMEPQVVVKTKGNYGKLSYLSSTSRVERERSLRSRMSDEVDKGFVAFSADYHAPRHHPPKNN